MDSFASFYTAYKDPIIALFAFFFFLATLRVFQDVLHGLIIFVRRHSP